MCLQLQNAQIQIHPMHAQSFFLTFGLRWYILSMILFVDSKGPDQTVQADLGLCCSHMPEDTFSHGVAQMKVYCSILIL